MTPRSLKLQVFVDVSYILENGMRGLKEFKTPRTSLTRPTKTSSADVARIIRPIKMAVFNHIRFNHEFN